MEPTQFFLREKEKYSAFNDDGIPTHDKEGKELSGKSKKVRGVKWGGEEKWMTIICKYEIWNHCISD